MTISPSPDKIRPLKLSYDGKLTIAEGRSRKETTWKHRELLWGQLLNKVSVTRRTGETLGEYRKMPKGQQDEIKDVGGFVGGTLQGGRRKAEAVKWRQLISLDADHAPKNFWSGVELLADYAMAVYSTHKHVPEAPRLRLMIPLSRPVTADEYQAVSRRIAADLGIDNFDDTTFEPSRLMYWPSTSSDGEFFFQAIDEPWLNPDTVLARYADWTDPAQWPESSRAHQERKKLADKQGDPTEKAGIVGAFCRTYDIEAAIEKFLPDIYSPCDIPGRYTYSEGTTSGGLVLYEDNFAFSHHGTDPTSGKLCNAFDLVRIHKFNDLDDEAKPGTPAAKMPSFRAMAELATDDETVRTTLGKERLAAAVEEFGDLEEDPEQPAAPETDPKWMTKLKINHLGEFDNTIDNVRLILENDPRIAGKIGFDDFYLRPVAKGRLPWRSKSEGSAPWSDTDDSGLRHYVETIYQIVAPTKIEDALKIVLDKRRFHPIREYLSKLTWDGVERLETLFIDYLGAEDCPYIRTVTRKTFVAAAGRAIKPGIKFDYMPILIGPQGVGKSFILNRMGRGWYSDSFYTVTGKEAYEQLLGAWIIEMAEMTATKKAEVEAIKHFISKQEDTFRMAYAKRPVTLKRQCVFVGTTNDRECLRDRTGNRRFWPVSVRVSTPRLNLWKELTDDVIDQIWAEATELWNQGEPLYLSGDLAKEAADRQEIHTEENAKAGVVREFLDREIPSDWDTRDTQSRKAWLLSEFDDESGEALQLRSKICAAEIWVECFGGDFKQFGPIQSREIGDILRGLPEWEPYVENRGRIRFKNYGLQKTFVRKIDLLN